MMELYKTCTRCKISKSVLDFTPTKNGKYKVHSRCRECQNISAKEWASENKERHNATKREWRARNPGRSAEVQRSFYQRNKAYYRSLESRYRARSKQAQPIWADVEKIQEIYEQRLKLSQETGLEYHVDHIYPLKGKLVSGLHVHTNLQILLAEENLKKNNRVEL